MDNNPNQQNNQKNDLTSGKPVLLDDKAGATRSANTSPSNQSEHAMNKEQIDGKVTRLQGKIKETWGKLTDNDIALYSGKRDQFFGKLKEHYGLAKEDAEKKLKALEDANNIAEKAA